MISLIRSIQKEADENKKEEPYLISIAERARQIMEDFTEKQKDAKKALEEILKLAEEKVFIQKMRKTSGLSPQKFVIYWALDKKKLDNSKDLAGLVSDSVNKFKNFYNNADENRQLKMDIYKHLSDSGVSGQKLKNLTDEIISLLKEMKK